MYNKKVKSFYSYQEKQTGMSLLCNSDGDNAEDIAFLKKKKIF